MSYAEINAWMDHADDEDAPVVRADLKIRVNADDVPSGGVDLLPGEVAQLDEIVTNIMTRNGFV